MKLSLKILAVSLSMTFLPSLPAYSQVMPEVDAPISATRQRAALIYQRIAGVKVPIDSQELKDMEALMDAGEMDAATDIPTQNPNFINVTVKHFATRISTRDETVLAPLSDFVATVMGNTRDNESAKRLLNSDIIYKADPARLPANANVRDNLVDDLIRSNNHYEDLERESRESRLDVGATLVEQRQQTLNGAGAPVNLPDAAGILTSRAYTQAHAIAGTNRRMVHHGFRNFLCTDVVEWADTELPSVYIGRDVDRAPGGVPATFNTTCKGCHSPMDALRGAFAHIDFPDDNDAFLKHGTLLPRGNGELQFRSNADTPEVAQKYSVNANVEPSGYVTTNSEWVNNLFVFGSKSAFFGWRNLPANGRGAGIKSFGQMMADSRAFSNCMAKRVYRSVCKREATGLEDSFISAAATQFEREDYNLRQLFKYVTRSPACIGQ